MVTVPGETCCDGVDVRGAVMVGDVDAPADGGRTELAGDGRSGGVSTPTPSAAPTPPGAVAMVTGTPDAPPDPSGPAAVG
jgi:hypothetical protein